MIKHLRMVKLKIIIRFIRNNAWKVFSCLFLIFFSCQKEQLPKPFGNLRLEYPTANYKEFISSCPFIFNYSTLAQIKTKKENCWFNIEYPFMKGIIYITYIPINKNNQLIPLIQESQKLVYEHTIKASGIEVKNFIFPEKKVYGSLYKLDGESASNLQFYITDSINHFLSGNVYFRSVPKPDSLRPAVDYITKDVVELIETIQWK